MISRILRLGVRVIEREASREGDFEDCLLVERARFGL